MPIYVHLVKMTREGAGKIRNLTPEYAKVRAFQDSLGAKDCVLSRASVSMTSSTY